MRYIDTNSFPEVLKGTKQPFHETYFAMYSSIYDGIITDPILMLVPVDDHMVHRGDGIFETFKCVDGNIYNMNAHFDRLQESAERVHLDISELLNGIEEKVIKTVRAGKHEDCLIRILISRGPGSFDVNPYDCPKPQLYIIISKLKKPFMETHPEGARIKSSSIAIKPAFFANIKNCNYLPNVLMKKEAVDAGVDFVVGFDEKGFLAEGATENIGIVTKEKKLLFPKLKAILRGTTMMRVSVLAEKLVKSGELKKVEFTHISREMLENAEEVLIVGTTPNVVMIREFDDKTIGSGKPGAIYEKLNSILLDDIYNNKDLLLKAF